MYCQMETCLRARSSQRRSCRLDPHDCPRRIERSTKRRGSGELGERGRFRILAYPPSGLRLLPIAGKKPQARSRLRPAGKKIRRPRPDPRRCPTHPNKPASGPIIVKPRIGSSLRRRAFHQARPCVHRLHPQHVAHGELRHARFGSWCQLRGSMGAGGVPRASIASPARRHRSSR